jgi:hypothetical protein
LAGAILAALSAGALAQTTDCFTDANGATLCDPQILHVTGPSATGSGPVFLNEGTTFEITRTSNGGASVNAPAYVAFIVPDGTTPGAMFDITGAVGVTGGTTLNYDGKTGTDHFAVPTIGVLDAFNSKTGLLNGPLVTLTSANPDFEKNLGFNGGGSISFQNLTGEPGLGGVTKFDVYVAAFPSMVFGSKSDTLTVDGNFPVDTAVVPFGLDITSTILTGNKCTHIGETSPCTVFSATAYTTSWTNTGFVNKLDAPVPEPSTWAMMLLGFAGLGYAAFRRRPSPRLA